MAILLATLAVSAATAQTTSLEAADRFAFGGPDDGSYRIYDRATGKLIASTDALSAQIYVLPENGKTNAYLLISQGWEDSWSFGVYRVAGADVALLFDVREVDAHLDVHDLNADGALDFTFYRFVESQNPIPTLLISRDFVSGSGGYTEQLPVCTSPRRALARQRIAETRDRLKRLSPVDQQAITLLEQEASRLSRGCPSQ